MYRLISSVAAALICLLPSAEAAPLPPDISKIVAFIFLADAAGNLATDKFNKPLPSGTAFFVGIKFGDGSNMFAYLVTAKHVLKDAQGNDLKKVYVRANSKDGNAKFLPLDLYENGKSMVLTHTDSTVDLAVISITPDMGALDIKMLGDDLVTTKESFKQLKISEGSDVFFVGLFTSFYGQHKNFPIARFGRVAMVSDEKIPWLDRANEPVQDADLYLLETQSYGGNSGSPVFFSLGPDRVPGQLFLNTEIRLAGVMRGTYLNLSPIEFRQVPTAVIPFSAQNIGIAAVTPSYLLHEILFSAPQIKKREDVIRTLKPEVKSSDPAPIPSTEPAK